MSIIKRHLYCLPMNLVLSIKGVILDPPYSKAKREKMWIALLKFVTSPGQKVLWDNISEASGSPTLSIFSLCHI